MMEAAPKKVLVVEDNAALGHALTVALRREAYQPLLAKDGQEGLDMARRESPDLVVLDVMLPKIDGFEVCRRLRRSSTVPILMLTAKVDEVDKIVGLELGADDYLTKPFSMRELMARVRAMLRRSEMLAARPSADSAERLSAGPLAIDVHGHEATLAGQPVGLTPKEFDLLVFLMQREGQVFSREQLLEKVWGYDYAGGSRTVDVHVRWLREKIEQDPSDPEHLLTVRGIGYKFQGR